MTMISDILAVLDDIEELIFDGIVCRDVGTCIYNRCRVIKQQAEHGMISSDQALREINAWLGIVITVTPLAAPERTITQLPYAQGDIPAATPRSTDWMMPVIRQAYDARRAVEAVEYEPEAVPFKSKAA